VTDALPDGHAPDGHAEQLRSEQDRVWIEAAIRLARENIPAGGGPFGALIVKDGEIVARGANRVTRDNDPTAHAEVQAIRQAGRALNDFNLSGAVLYSSCEPCPMCLAAALWSRLDRVVYAADRHDAAAAGFDDSEFYELLDTDRDTWTLPRVQVLRPSDAADPFELWNHTADRVEY